MPTDWGGVLRQAIDLDRQGHAEAALAAFESVAENVCGGEGEVSLWHAIATLRFRLGRPQAALEACAVARRLAPDNPQTLFNTGVVLESLGQAQAALDCYAQALEKDAFHLGALLNQVSLLLSEKRLAEATPISQAAIAAYPDNADCWFNHGEVLTTASQHEQALAAYERAFSLQPSCIKADIAAAVAEAALGRLASATRRLAAVAAAHPQALASFRSPLETDRESAYPDLEAGRIALMAAYQRFRSCDWSAREAFLVLFQRVVAGDGCRPLDNPDLPFLGIGLPLSGACRLQAARQVATRIAAGVKGVSLTRPSRKAREKLRIGYLSGDFRQHASAWLMSRLPGLHDRERFTVHVYSTGPDDKSDLRGEIIAGADAFCDVAHLDAAHIAQRIAMDEIDILVDLSGYTLFARSAVLALRPAPVQVSYLAYLQTSGAAWIDYVLLDRMVLQPSERPFWQEKIAYLPGTLYLCDDRATVALDVSRREAGLPDDAFVFCCLNAAWKIDPEVFSCWMDILHRVPHAVLWLYADLPECVPALRGAAQEAGVDARRLIFARAVPQAVHCARFRLADVFLDTFVCNAHTTGIEALAAGVPVLTLPGESVVARVAASLLAAHGVPELIAGSRVAYVEMAIRLANDADWREEIGQRVRRRSGSGLFCTQRRVRDIENAYEHMWERHMAGLPPADFDVPESTA